MSISSVFTVDVEQVNVSWKPAGLLTSIET